MTLLLLCGALALIAGVADFFFAATWWPPFFRSGPIVYRATVPFQFPRVHGPRFIPTADALEEEFPDMAFEQLGENEVALRERIK